MSAASLYNVWVRYTYSEGAYWCEGNSPQLNSAKDACDQMITRDDVLGCFVTQGSYIHSEKMYEKNKP